jgi:hypothetical protein
MRRSLPRRLTTKWSQCKNSCLSWGEKQYANGFTGDLMSSWTTIASTRVRKRGHPVNQAALRFRSEFRQLVVLVVVFVMVACANSSGLHERYRFSLKSYLLTRTLVKQPHNYSAPAHRYPQKPSQSQFPRPSIARRDLKSHIRCSRKLAMPADESRKQPCPREPKSIAVGRRNDIDDIFFLHGCPKHDLVDS